MPVEVIWSPIGVNALEEDAEVTVRADSSRLVIAGPGAGKTELLAQRAAYLLQTGACADPQRILALSLKRDAARNLAERVRKRIGPTLAARLDSFTFDAFAKGMVDRFREALPAEWRATANYGIDFRLPSNTRDAVLAIPDALLSVAQRGREALAHKDGVFFRKYVVGAALPLIPGKEDTEAHVVARALWKHRLHGLPNGSELAFPMITRLAQFILTENPMLLAALRGTYGFVFLDEFQDTTGPQYLFMRTAFVGSSTVITAVGDPKQCVMRWAGAEPRVFPAIKKDFGAIETKLKQNHRSASSLVAVQAVIARRIDPDAPLVEAVGEGANATAECLLLEYNDAQEEANDLAARIDRWIREDKLNPREICVLTRQTPGVYGEKLMLALKKLGRRARVEQELQDLLSEPLTTALLDVLHLAMEPRAPASWVRAIELLERLDPALQVAEKASELLMHHLDQLKAALDDGASVTAIVDVMTGFHDEARFRASEPTYRAGNLYAETRALFVSSLEKARDGRGWPEAIAELEGVGAVPILTAHKSKGLEYHTIIFVGLEDSAHWGFAKAPEEETSVFFVALSLAKRRVVATFADVRVTRAGRRAEQQSHECIQSFYDALAEAGVHAVRVGVT